MGMFDYIVAICPNCHTEMDAQVKHGPCCLAVFNIQPEMSIDDAVFVHNLRLNCHNCRKSFNIIANIPEEVTVKLEEICK